MVTPTPACRAPVCVACDPACFVEGIHFYLVSKVHQQVTIRFRQTATFGANLSLLLAYYTLADYACTCAGRLIGRPSASWVALR